MIEFLDGIIVEVEDYEGFCIIISDWKEVNFDVEECFFLSFLLEILSEDGELIIVELREDLF